MSEIPKRYLYGMLTGVINHHDKALSVYGTQIMNEVLGIIDCYFSYLENDTDKLSVEKLQEQLNTAKKALAEIAEMINEHVHKCDLGCDNFCELDGSLGRYSVEDLKSVTDLALAAIGGDDE